MSLKFVWAVCFYRTDKPDMQPRITSLYQNKEEAESVITENNAHECGTTNIRWCVQEWEVR